MLDKALSFLKAVKNRPKTALVVLALIGSLGYVTYTRVPAAVRCGYAAVIDQSVPWELWRFNAFSMNCQYYNGTRWINLLKVMDVGTGLTETLEN